MIWHFALSILGHWLLVAIGVVLIAFGIAKPWKLVIPDFLFSVALAAGVALSGGGYLYDAGYRGALHGVEVARLRDDLAQADENIALLQQTAKVAAERERAAAEQRQSDNEKVRAYETELARKNSDIDLSRADLERLRGIVEDATAESTRAATAVRAARRSSFGCKATLAEYVGALNESNRRLLNDAAFYRDVRQRFGSPR